jgi:hypothetical protein
MSLRLRKDYRSHITGSYVAILALLLLTSCSSDPNPWEPQQLSKERASDSHRIESKRLKQLMNSLYQTVYGQGGSTQESDERRRQALTLADGVDTMSGRVLALPDDRNGPRLSVMQLVVFERHAISLGNQAKEIRRIANEQQMDGLNGAIDDLVEQCDDCHRLFRSKKAAAP